jgi:hypothetical protein
MLKSNLCKIPLVPDLPEHNYCIHQGPSVCGTTFQKTALFVNMCFH